MAYVLADPSSKLNFSHDWETLGWLADGDSISSRQWSITMHEGGGSPNAPVLFGDTDDIVYVSGMLPGYIYHLTESVVTSAGIEDQRSIVIRCDQT